LGDVIAERPQFTLLIQRIAGVQHGQDLALFIGDLNLAVVERAAVQQAFAQHLAIAVQRLAPGRFQVREILSFNITADIIFALTVAHMEKKPGHVPNPLLLQQKERESRAPVPVPIFEIAFLGRELAARSGAPYKPGLR
jgi:hypothetical protein